MTRLLPTSPKPPALTPTAGRTEAETPMNEGHQGDPKARRSAVHMMGPGACVDLGCKGLLPPCRP